MECSLWVEKWSTQLMLTYLWLRQRIAGLENCTSLIELDLTGNNVTEMTGMGGLLALKKLTLTSNRITEVSGIQSLLSLEHLLLQANMLASIESCSLDMLSNLPKLRTLYLRNIDRTQVRAGVDMLLSSIHYAFMP